MGKHTQKLRLTKRGQLVATTLGGFALVAYFIGAHYLVYVITTQVGAA